MGDIETITVQAARELEAMLDLPRLQYGKDFTAQVISGNAPQSDAEQKYQGAYCDHSSAVPKIVYVGEARPNKARHELMHIYHRHLNPSLVQFIRGTDEKIAQLKRLSASDAPPNDICRSLTTEIVQRMMDHNIAVESVAYGYEHLVQLVGDRSVILPQHEVTITPNVSRIRSWLRPNERAAIKNYDEVIEQVQNASLSQTPVTVYEVPITNPQAIEQLVNAAYDAGWACSTRMFTDQAVEPKATLSVMKAPNGCKYTMQFVHKYMESDQAKARLRELMLMPLEQCVAQQVPGLLKQQAEFRRRVRTAVDNAYRR